MSHPPRLRRSESFLGIHFDFHCRADDREIGRRVTPAMVRDLLARVRPDYIQIDCKGHPGVTSYPSRFGTQPRSFARDPLPIWRRETERAGVALFMHYSGVWDAEAVRRHPKWARHDAKGRTDGRTTSVFGAYVDKLMIPQLLELARDYGVDGVWVDGDCWATAPDYSPRARSAWRKATGKRKLPKSPGDPDWHAFRAFCREGFRAYVRHYTEELHHQAPGFQVASNWACSSHMPEFPQFPVDFLSGDFWPHDSVNSARFEGRILESQGQPWDLMAWGFGTRSSDAFKPKAPKTPLQLRQEAALVLALGGGFQCYFSQKRDGSISRADVETFAAVAPFCRERQRWCHRSVRVPQIAILYSTGALYRDGADLFRPWCGAADGYRGVLQALIESNLAVDAIHDGHLAEPDAGQWPLIVVPEWKWLSRTAVDQLRSYARDGGRLLLIGSETARHFARELGVKHGPKGAEERRFWDFGSATDAAGDPVPLAGLLGEFRPVRCGPGVRTLGRLYTEHDRAGVYTPAATVRDFGKGRIAALHAPLGARYLSGRSASVRFGLATLVRELFPDPMVELVAHAPVDLVVRRLPGNDSPLAIHLVNTSGPHASDFTWNYLSPTGPLTLRLRLPTPPSEIRLQPENRKLRFRPDPAVEGATLVSVPPIGVHGVVVVKA